MDEEPPPWRTQAEEVSTRSSGRMDRMGRGLQEGRAGLAGDPRKNPSRPDRASCRRIVCGRRSVWPAKRAKRVAGEARGRRAVGIAPGMALRAVRRTSRRVAGVRWGSAAVSRELVGHRSASGRDARSGCDMPPVDLPRPPSRTRTEGLGRCSGGACSQVCGRLGPGRLGRAHRCVADLADLAWPTWPYLASADLVREPGEDEPVAEPGRTFTHSECRCAQ